METRQLMWRARLMGDAETCARKRELYHSFVKGRTIKNKSLVSTIRADMPRTFVQNEDIDTQPIERLLLEYASIQRGDGYLQGFNYMMAILFHVFRDTDESMADTWWCFSRIVGLIRPMMPDFNVAWFHWYRRQWSDEFHRHLKKRRPLLNSILYQRHEEFSSLMTIRWFMIWFAQTITFEEIHLLWDFIIQQPPKLLMRVYMLLASAIVEEAATSISYNSEAKPVETMHNVLSLQVRGVSELLKCVQKRL